MATIFTRRIVLVRCIPKLRSYLTARELSCYPSLTLYYHNHRTFTDTRTNCILKNVKLEPPGIALRRYSQDAPKESKGEGKKKLSLFQRFKEMYKKYWYVLVPVHLVTSACWFGGFYYLAKSGVDIISILQSLNFSETLIKPFRDSSMGYVAVAYGLYKIATPLRYTVTLGGTTLSINYLKKWGYIKPVPTSEELKEMYLEKKENLIDSVRGRKEEFWHKTDKLREKKDEFIDDIKDKKEHFGKSLKDTQSKILRKKDEMLRLKNVKNKE